jgi:hypothetical protein
MSRPRTAGRAHSGRIEAPDARRIVLPPHGFAMRDVLRFQRRAARESRSPTKPPSTGHRYRRNSCVTSSHRVCCMPPGQPSLLPRLQSAILSANKTRGQCMSRSKRRLAKRVALAGQHAVRSVQTRRARTGRATFTGHSLDRAIHASAGQPTPLPRTRCLPQNEGPARGQDSRGTRRRLRAVELGLPFDDIARCAAHARVS